MWSQDNFPRKSGVVVTIYITWDCQVTHLTFDIHILNPAVLQMSGNFMQMILVLINLWIYTVYNLLNRCQYEAVSNDKAKYVQFYTDVLTKVCNMSNIEWYSFRLVTFYFEIKNIDPVLHSLRQSNILIYSWRNTCIVNFFMYVLVMITY